MLLVLSACDLGGIKSYSSEKIGVKTNLMMAAEHGDPREIRKLLDEGVDVNAVHKKQTALHYAVLRVPTKPDIVRILVEAGADPDGRTGTQPPLVLAVQGKQTDLVELLIDLGADVNKKGGRKMFPLVIWISQIAGEADHPDRDRRLAVTKKMIEAGADLHLRGATELFQSPLITPMQAASAKHDTELLRMLRDAGARY